MIKFENVSKVFRGKGGAIAAISDLSFEVPTGSFFTLVGPSGCGKTTTMRMLAGLETPDSGRIEIGDRTVFSSQEGLNTPTNKRDISMVFQSYAIWPHMSVFDNVAYPLRVKRVPRAEIRERVEDMLTLVGLPGMGSRQATQLSGGQQQRVAAARALVSQPEVLLLDEPLSNLDAKLRARMRNELKNLQQSLGVTTLYVTHDQQEALSMSDELCVMDKGVIVQRGQPVDVYQQPRNSFTAEFIGATNLLLGTATRPIVQGINTLSTAVGPLRACASMSLPPAQRLAYVSIRPGAINFPVRHGNSSQTNLLRARLRSSVFLGDTLDCEFEVGDEVLKATGQALYPTELGEWVELEIEPHRCTILVGEDPEEGVARHALRPSSEEPADDESVSSGSGRDA